MSEISFNEQEQEVIRLKHIIETLDLILNHKVLELRGNDPDTTIYFHTAIHQKYFYIILLDFLSKPAQELIGENLSGLDMLINIKENPHFNTDKSISELIATTKVFQSWVNKEITVDVWLPTIDNQCKVKLKRGEFIKICGNISKHNFARLTGVSKQICRILKRNENDISLHDSLLILNEFYERFHDDILNYHSSNIVEMLNNIQWGIHDYLLPEFNKSYEKDDSDRMRYRYIYPRNIKNEFVKKCYWDLMNSIRTKPRLRKFESTKYLKMTY